MLELLKAEGAAWAAILACKAPREDARAFEKKVKNQFSLVPFEDITPVVQEVSLDSGETGEKDGTKKAASTEDKAKGEEEVMEEENWGTVVATPLDSEGEEEADRRKVDSKAGKVEICGTGEKIVVSNGKETNGTDPKNVRIEKADETLVKTGDGSCVVEEKDLDKTEPFEETNGGTESKEEEDMDQTQPFVDPKDEASSNGLKRKKKAVCGPASKVKKVAEDSWTSDEEEPNEEVKETKEETSAVKSTEKPRADDAWTSDEEEPNDDIKEVKETVPVPRKETVSEPSKETVPVPSKEEANIKNKLKAGPASKVKKVAENDDDVDEKDTANSAKDARNSGEVKEPQGGSEGVSGYAALLEGRLTLESGEEVEDRAHLGAGAIDRKVLLYSPDTAGQEEVARRAQVEACRRVVGEGGRQVGASLLTFTDSESAEAFLEEGGERASLRQWSRERGAAEVVGRDAALEARLARIEAKIDFPGRRKEGVTQGLCVVAAYREQVIGEVELLDSLPEEVEEVEKVEERPQHGDFVLMLASEEEAVKFARAGKLEFKGVGMAVELLTDMMTRRRFAHKAKNFKDDAQFGARDDSRRVAVPWPGGSPEELAEVERHLRETRPGLLSCLLATVPQQAAPPAAAGLLVAAFKDQVAAAEALAVQEDDQWFLERGERMDLLGGHLAARQAALDRHRARHTGAKGVAEENIAVGKEQTQNTVKTTKIDEKVEESCQAAAAGRLVRCEGFTEQDCDVEEYFAENHEQVEAVEQRGAEVLVRFADRQAAERFVTLHYVRYKGRRLGVARVGEGEGEGHARLQ